MYARYMDMVYGVCLKYFKEPEEAKDAVIHIFEELIGKLLKYEVTNFRSWLHRLVRNYCLMQLRSKKSHPVKVDTDVVYLKEDAHPENIEEKEMALNEMAKCLEKLPPDQKQVIKLFYLEEKCYKEIADMTQLEPGKVRSFIQNGRRNLKICMEKQALEINNR